MAPNIAPIRIATRGSALALAQSRLVLGHCRSLFPDLAFELVIIKTSGDKWQAASLTDNKLPKGLFTKELETALLENKADVAVHSLKDLPTDLPGGLVLGAVSPRADVRDLLIVRHAENEPGSRVAPLRSIDDLPDGAVVATSSTRRAAQIAEQRPDVRIVPIRGNVGTRLRKLHEQTELHATILAAAGLDRLNIKRDNQGRLTGPDVPEGLVATPLAVDRMLPCVGQAALGFEICEGNAAAAQICAKLNDEVTFKCVSAERSFLRAMGGGCHLAVAALAEVRGEQLHLKVVSYLGSKPLRAEGSAKPADAEDLGRRLARELGAV